MIKCATSLWSADLSNLEREIKRIEPYSDRFHIDMIDGHYLPSLLFFPDLVKACRKHTKLPFEVHIMATDPMSWIDPFCEAGGDRFLVGYGEVDLKEWSRELRARGKQLGVVLRIDQSPQLVEPHLDLLDTVTLLGTAVGIKGAGMDPALPERIGMLRKIIDSRGANVEIQCDGGIRRHTVPLMRAAGADCIVPGSLMFNDDPDDVRKWLASLDAPTRAE